MDDFSHEHLFNWDDQEDNMVIGADGIFLSSEEILNAYVIAILNASRDAYLKTKKKIKNASDSDEAKRLEALAKKYWWQMIQLLPTSYNQRRTVELNYEVLAGIYQYRKNHKLDEWREFCSWIEQLPYSEIITCSVKESKDEPVIPVKGSGPNGYVRTKEEMERDRNAEIESLKKRIQELEGKNDDKP